MNYDENDLFRDNWPDNRERVQQQWSKLNDSDLQGIDGRRDHLISRLQERYGYSRERAEEECQNFVDGLESQASSPRSERKPGWSDRQGISGTMPSGNARASGSPSPQSGTSRSSSSTGSSGSTGSSSGSRSASSGSSSSGSSSGGASGSSSAGSSGSRGSSSDSNPNRSGGR